MVWGNLLEEQQSTLSTGCCREAYNGVAILLLPVDADIKEKIFKVVHRKYAHNPISK